MKFEFDVYIYLSKNSDKYIGEKISLNENTTYQDINTKQPIPEKLVKKHHAFRIVEYSAFTKKFKVMGELKNVLYTTFIDGDYVVYKLGKK